MWLLKDVSRPIPGNFYYVQNEPLHRFEAAPLLEDLVSRVSKFRIANRLKRASLAEVFQDVVEFQCRLVNNDPNLCIECDDFASRYQNHPFFRPCGSCGTISKVN